MRRRFHRRTRRTAAAAVLAITTALAIPLAIPLAAASAAGAATGNAAPSGFKAQSTTWVDKAHGFLLGSAPCGPKTCTDVLGTTDAGATWALVGRPHAPIADPNTPKHPGVTELRFGTSTSGWAFAPLLRHTADGGRSWTTEAVPGGVGQVIGLTADAAGSWAVVSPCAWGHSSQSCRRHSLTLWRTTTASGTHWTQVQATLPYSFATSISAFGSTVYVVDPQLEFGGDDVLLASTDGVTFSPRTAPCDHTQDLELIQVVATSATDVAELCDGDPGFSKAVKTVYTSKDTGTSLTNRGTMGLYGIQAQLAASPSGNLTVASWSDGSFIYANDTRGKTWLMPVGLGDGGRGWNDIQYVTNTEAYVVYSPAGSFEGLGQLWVTHDGGRQWHTVDVTG